MCAKKAFHSLYVLLLSEPRKVIEVGQCRVQHPSKSQPYRPRSNGHGGYLLGIVNVPTIVLSFRVEGIQNQRSFGERQGVDILELAKVQNCGSFLITRSRGLGSRGARVINLPRRGSSWDLLFILHCESSCIECAEADFSIAQYLRVCTLCADVGRKLVNEGDSDSEKSGVNY